MNNAAINIIGRDRCSGCYGCFNACSVQAISMEKDAEGFYTPIVDSLICNNCSICQKHCPVIYPNKCCNLPLVAYAGWSNNLFTLQRSSSGGIITEIAEYVLEQNGVVFGVAWNSELEVQHIAVTSKSELNKIQGSKYLQSIVGDSYKKIKYVIEKEQKLVLFIGTPCQVNALRTFIEHDNLITIDLVCHGIPSYNVFSKYILDSSNNKKVVEVNFRDKRTGWSNFSVTLKFSDGETSSTSHHDNAFFASYLQNLFLNKLCYNCPFSTMPRSGDITAGDFWGVKKSLYNKDQGVSILVTNSSKGDYLVNDLFTKKRINIRKVPIEQGFKSNPRMYNGIMSIPAVRDSIVTRINSIGFTEFKNNYIKMPSIREKTIYSIKNKIKRLWSYIALYLFKV